LKGRSAHIKTIRTSILMEEKEDLKLSLQAEQYLYEEWEQKLKRMKNVYN